MSALWSALDDIDGYYGSVPDDDDDGDVCIPAPVAIPRPARSAAVSTPANPDALTDAPSGVELSLKGREALHPSPIRAHERQMALVANGDPQAVALARACVLWLAQRTSPEATK